MKERKGEHPLGDLGQIILAVAFIIIWLNDSFSYHWTTFLHDLVPESIRMGFLVIMLITSFILIKNSHFILEGEKRPNYVVQTGAFKYVRHPLYLAAVLTYLGTAVSSLSLISLVLLIPIFIFYNYIATYEERLLEEKLGKAYKDYEEKTGKWFPKFKPQE
jgi:protein-S-isoprenylcysteine O-methyltransferase Ste14